VREKKEKAETREEYDDDSYTYYDATGKKGLPMLLEDSWVFVQQHPHGKNDG